MMERKAVSREVAGPSSVNPSGLQYAPVREPPKIEASLVLNSDNAGLSPSSIRADQVKQKIRTIAAVTTLPRALFWTSVASVAFNACLIVKPSLYVPLFSGTNYSEFTAFGISLATAAVSGIASWWISSRFSRKLSALKHILRGECESCGYSVIGWGEKSRCPECFAQQTEIGQFLN